MSGIGGRMVEEGKKLNPKSRRCSGRDEVGWAGMGGDGGVDDEGIHAACMSYDTVLRTVHTAYIHTYARPEPVRTSFGKFGIPG